MLDGQATFEIDDETIERPQERILFVQPEARRKATGDGPILALGGTVGEAYQGLDWVRPGPSTRSR